MTAGPITFDTLDRYARRYAIRGEEWEELLHHVRAMDSVYLQWLEEKRKREQRK